MRSRCKSCDICGREEDWLMRSKKVVINAIVQALLELVTIASGFIVPNLIIGHYGSDTNGLIVSITQFLGYLTLLQTGIGGVAKAALYKPLAQNDSTQISTAVNALRKFFKGMGYGSAVYMAILMVVFPVLIEKNADPFQTAALVVIIWIGTFAQYCFGQTYQYLLQADQRGYIFAISQIAVVILNTIIAVVMINNGFSIIMVKLVSASVFVLRPILLEIYCKKKYKIDTKLPPDMDLIKQRWDGVGHTVAYFIHSKTDVFLLTTICNFTEVSVYNVYYSVAYGLSMILSTLANSIQATFGNMIARDERENLENSFYKYVWINRLAVNILFSTGIITVIPFMQVYTRSFTDAGEYMRQLFAMLIMISQALYCIRMPYHTVVLAAGRYKETKNGAFIEAGINIVVSLALIWKWGMIGVTLGTVAAMLYRTIDYIVYMSKNLFDGGIGRNMKYLVKDILILAVVCVISTFLNKTGLFVSISNYFAWLLLAGTTFVAVSAVFLPIWIIEDRQTFNGVKKTMLQMLRKK